MKFPKLRSSNAIKSRYGWISIKGGNKKGPTTKLPIIYRSSTTCAIKWKSFRLTTFSHSTSGTSRCPVNGFKKMFRIFSLHEQWFQSRRVHSHVIAIDKVVLIDLPVDRSLPSHHVVDDVNSTLLFTVQFFNHINHKSLKVKRNSSVTLSTSK